MSRRTRIALAAAVAALNLVIVVAPASAATLTVCPSGCTYGTIQGAIDNAHSGDTIKIAAAASPYAGFNVPGGNSNGLTSVTLTGAGAGKTTIGGGTGSVVDIDSGVSVKLGGVTITGGQVVSGLGGGIENFGTLTLSNSTVTANTARFGSGGGIRNSGTATIDNSQVSGNSAGNLGGGIFNDVGATLTLNNSTVRNNAASGEFNANTFGGGIFNVGTLRVNNSPVTGNTVSTSGIGRADGGGIANFGLGTVTGTATINNSPITGNMAPNGSVGGILNDGGTLTLSNSTVRCNSPIDIGPPDSYTQINSKIGPPGPC